MGLIYIALSILCSLLLAQVLKIAEKKKLNVLQILISNYFFAFLISLFSSGTQLNLVERLSGSLNGWILPLMILLGIVFIANLQVYSRSIHRVGMGISFAAMRMSLIFPIAVSLFVFGEHIEWIKYAGIVLALLSLLLMIPRIKTANISGINEAWLPILIFLMTGMADTGMKVYEQLFSNQISEDIFLAGIFLVSFLTGMVILIYRRSLDFTWKEVLYGSAAGVVNLYASVFLIKALKLMPGSVVFPLINVTLVILGTFIGMFVWKDHLTRKQGIGLAIAITSIFLLV